jgi:hypothetical protein
MSEPLKEWDFASEDNRGFHEAADIFPRMTDEEFQAFKQDIAENGLQTAIVTIPDGQIIDGRHRWRACMETHTQPRYQVYHGNPWTYVISANLHRRHLNTSQRAMVVARIADRKPGLRNQAAPRKRGADHLPPTQGQAAELLNIGLSSVTDARRVMRRGTPELRELVDDGLAAVSTAARVSGMDQDIQREFVNRVRGGERPTDVARVPIEIPPPAIKRKLVPVTTFTGANADALSSGLIGIHMAFKDVTSIDTDVSSTLAKTLGGQIKTTKTVLNRLQKLLAEVTEGKVDQ